MASIACAICGSALSTAAATLVSSALMIRAISSAGSTSSSADAGFRASVLDLGFNSAKLATYQVNGRTSYRIVSQEDAKVKLGEELDELIGQIDQDVTVETTIDRLRVLGADINHPAAIVDIRAPASGVGERRCVRERVRGGRDVQLALLKSAHTPLARVLAFVRAFSTHTIQDILKHSRLPATVKMYLLEELGHRAEREKKRMEESQTSDQRAEDGKGPDKPD